MNDEVKETSKVQEELCMYVYVESEYEGVKNLVRYNRERKN